MIHFTCLSFKTLTLEELYAVMALRQEVFVVEQNCPYLDADGKDPASWHLLGRNDRGELLAYARLMPPGIAYPKYLAMGRVVTAPGVRGQGLGRALVQEALEWIEQQFGATPVKISAQTYLIGFYESFGFQTIGKPYLEDDIPHIAMVRR